MNIYIFQGFYMRWLHAYNGAIVQISGGSVYQLAKSANKQRLFIFIGYYQDCWQFSGQTLPVTGINNIVFVAICCKINNFISDYIRWPYPVCKLDSLDISQIELNESQIVNIIAAVHRCMPHTLKTAYHAWILTMTQKGLTHISWTMDSW